MTQSFPQRVTLPVRPGSLLKRIAIAPVSCSAGADRDLSYLALVRACPCLHCGMEPSEAAHIRMASAAFGKASGLGKKPEDRWVVSLCAEHHRLARHAQHNRGELQFWYELGISPLIVAEQLYAKRGDLVAMRAVVISAIAQRSIR